MSAAPAASTSAILLVEDNWITRKMARVALSAEGYRVVDAGDARAALEKFDGDSIGLVFLDVVLPDESGFTVARRLRDRPAGREVPIIAFTGFLARNDESKIAEAGFNDVLLKPVAPSMLVEIARRYLAAAAPSASGAHGRGRRVIVVDDDPVQRKLLALRLEQLGFDVHPAVDGLEALTLADEILPEAIVSDVLMPGLDGFALAKAVRKSPRFGKIPIVLASNSLLLGDREVEAADRYGADALVARTPDFEAVIAALFSGLDRAPARAPVPVATPAQEERPPAASIPVATAEAGRLVLQLERQASMNAGLAQRCAMQAAELSVLGAISTALEAPDVEASLEDVLMRCLDVGGASRGAIYLVEAHGELSLRAALGFTKTEPLRDFFGSADVLRDALASGEPVLIPGKLEPARATALLERAGLRGLLIAPIRHGEQALGAVVLSSENQALEEDWIAFARVVGGQLGQAIVLGRTIRRLTSETEFNGRVLRGSSDGIVAFDATGRVNLWSAGMERIAGSAASAALGQSWSQLAAASHPWARQVERALRGAEVDVADEELAFPGRSLHADVRLSPLREGDRIVGALAILRDVTERKKAESRLAVKEAELLQAQKMEAIGRLAGGVAHDFNNLLTVILSYSKFAAEGLEESNPTRADIMEIRAAAERAASLTRQLLIFSRKDVMRPEVIDLDRLVANLEKLLRRTIGEDVKLATSLAGGLWRVNVDPGQVEQAVINLAINARDAMPHGGTLTLSTANVDVAAGGAQKGGRYARLEVRDTGEGMNAEVLGRIFEPFFTTKPKGKGTGLGLSMVYGFARQAGGFVEVESEPGKGSAFRILLPATEEAASGAREIAAGTRAQADAGGRTVLVVEDEDAVRTLTRRILERAGYKVIEARHGEEALALAAIHPVAIDLLLTDVVMPGMRGTELVKRFLGMRPGAKTLLMSGYVDDPTLQSADGADVLTKPFAEEDLLRRIASLLPPPTAG